MEAWLVAVTDGHLRRTAYQVYIKGLHAHTPIRFGLPRDPGAGPRQPADNHVTEVDNSGKEISAASLRSLVQSDCSSAASRYWTGHRDWIRGGLPAYIYSRPDYNRDLSLSRYPGCFGWTKLALQGSQS